VHFFNERYKAEDLSLYTARENFWHKIFSHFLQFTYIQQLFLLCMLRKLIEKTVTCMTINLTSNSVTLFQNILCSLSNI
jgi:hypothetical protein